MFPKPFNFWCQLIPAVLHDLTVQLTTIICVRSGQEKYMDAIMSLAQLARLGFVGHASSQLAVALVLKLPICRPGQVDKP